MFFKVLIKTFLNRGRHKTLNFRIIQFGFCLGFELQGFRRHFYINDSGQAFLHIISGKSCFLFSVFPLCAFVVIRNGAGQGNSKSGYVGSAIGCINAVDKTFYIFVKWIGILKRSLAGNSAVVFFNVNNVSQNIFAAVAVGNQRLYSALKIKSAFVAIIFINKMKSKTGNQVCPVTEQILNFAVLKCNITKNCLIGNKSSDSSRTFNLYSPLFQLLCRCLPHFLYWFTLMIFLVISLAVPKNNNSEIRRKRIGDGCPDSV